MKAGKKNARPKSLEELSAFVASVDDRRHRDVVLQRLLKVAQLIDKHCPNIVYSAIAFGHTINRLTDRHLFTQSRNGVGFLTITKMDNVARASEVLSEKVFGPVLMEFGKLPDLHIWTMQQFEEAKTRKHLVWARALREGVTIYGESLLTEDDTSDSRSRLQRGR